MPPPAPPAPSAACLLLRLGLGRRPVHLGPVRPLLHARQVRGHRPGHLPGVPRPVVPLGRQAPLAQGDQLGVRPAAVEPGEGVVQLPADRHQPDRLRRVGDVRRLAGEDHAEDRPEAEHVGPLVELVDLAAGLLRGHVRRRAQHAPGAPSPTRSRTGPCG